MWKRTPPLTHPPLLPPGRAGRAHGSSQLGRSGSDIDSDVDSDIDSDLDSDSDSDIDSDIGLDLDSDSDSDVELGN